MRTFNINYKRMVYGTITVEAKSKKDVLLRWDDGEYDEYLEHGEVGAEIESIEPAFLKLPTTNRKMSYSYGPKIPKGNSARRGGKT